MAKHGNKETLMITLQPDSKVFITNLAKKNNTSVSSILENFIAKEQKRANRKKKENTENEQKG